jgi:hypothetical protein
MASELDLGLATIKKWKQELLDKGQQFEHEKQKSSTYSADQKFAAVLATATVYEHELASYCREHGLFVEYVKSWKAVAIAAHKPSTDSQYKLDTAQRADRKKIKHSKKSYLEKTRRWLKPRRYWYCGKSTMPSGTTARKINSFLRAA